MMIKNKKKLLFLCLLVILIATAYISFVTGTIKLSFNDLFTKFTTGSNEAVDSIIDLRLPRILIALEHYYKQHYKILWQRRISLAFHQVHL